MTIIALILATFLTLSLSLNAVLFVKSHKKDKRPQSVELQEFLADLLSGVGIVAVGRVDPNAILLRSPKK